MSGKALTELTRGELLEKCLDLIEALHKKHEQLREAKRDLPFNKAANERHQLHKRAWGRRKAHLLGLLIEAQRLLELADKKGFIYSKDIVSAIQYELDCGERDFQKHLHRKKIRRLHAAASRPLDRA